MTSLLIIIGKIVFASAMLAFTTYCSVIMIDAVRDVFFGNSRITPTGDKPVSERTEIDYWQQGQMRHGGLWSKENR